MMELSTLITVSCVLTGISMFVFIGVIAFFARYGGKGMNAIFSRITGGLLGNKDDKEKNAETGRGGQQVPAISSGQSFRQRAQSLEFPAPPASPQQFGAQAYGQQQGFPPPAQASLTPRMGQQVPLRASGQQFQQQQSLPPSTPSLSPSRPFNAGQQSFGNYPQQGYAQQQGGLRPSQPSQQGYQQAPQQGYQQAQQQGGLGQNLPPLQSRPRPNLGNTTGSNQYLRGRDDRRREGFDDDVLSALDGF